MKQRRLDDLSQLVDLFLAAADVTVRNIGFLFHLHHCDCRVDLWRQRNVNLVLVSVDTVNHEICTCNLFTKYDRSRLETEMERDALCKLFSTIRFKQFLTKSNQN